MTYEKNNKHLYLGITKDLLVKIKKINQFLEIPQHIIINSALKSQLNILSSAEDVINLKPYFEQHIKFIRYDNNIMTHISQIKRLSQMAFLLDTTKAQCIYILVNKGLDEKLKLMNLKQQYVVSNNRGY